MAVMTDRALGPLLGHTEDRPHPPDTLLPADPAAAELAAVAAGDRNAAVAAGDRNAAVAAGDRNAAVAAGDRNAAVAAAAAHPSSTGAWAALAEAALDADQPVAAYAYARTGYHRGLDQLRRAGWRGAGPVPWGHLPNRGWLRAVAALARAAECLDEPDEAVRCRQLLADSSPAAVRALLPDSTDRL